MEVTISRTPHGVRELKHPNGQGRQTRLRSRTPHGVRELKLG